MPSLDTPPLHRLASRQSAAGQRTYLRLTRARVAGLVVAAVGGGSSLHPGWDLSGMLTVVGFAVAAAVELVLLITRPERRWWEGRAVAESVKTLSWLYAVGGHPFPVTLPAQEAAALFGRRLDEIARQLELPAGPNRPTSGMDAVRA